MTVALWGIGWAVEGALLAVLLWRLARTAATASVARLTLWSFGLRSVVGLGLFMASFYHLPLFRSMQ
ncbi:MAG TPA: hypothetical protein VF157_04195, partial [Chloroflexota bacterium]